jgi:large subunit ribosomal protein L25
MTETALNAESGRTTGSASARRLRTEDKIPAVVYGMGMEPVSIAVGRRDLRVALSGAAGLNTILDLTVDGTVYPSLIKDIQRHPVRLTIQHIDFIQVDLNAQVTVSVPVRLEGEAKEVLQNNGLVDLALTELDVTTTPRNIPDEFVIDVTDMTVDDVIRVGDVPLPAGVVAAVDEDAPVVTVLTMRVIEEEPEVEEGEEGVEGEEGAEGEAGEEGGGDDAGADAGGDSGGD